MALPLAGARERITAPSESSPCPALLARIDPTGRRRLIPSG